MADLYRAARDKKESILKRIKAGTEGTIVLVGELECLKQPAVALIREETKDWGGIKTEALFQWTKSQRPFADILSHCRDFSLRD